MVKEADQHIEETPASHKKNIQRYALIGGAVIILLSVVLLFWKSHEREAKIEAARAAQAALDAQHEEQKKQKKQKSPNASFDEQLAARRQALLKRVDEAEANGAKFDPETQKQIDKIRSEQGGAAGTASAGSSDRRAGSRSDRRDGERDPIADFYLKEKLRALGSSIRPYDAGGAAGRSGGAGGAGAFSGNARPDNFSSTAINPNAPIAEQQRQVQQKLAELKQLRERLTGSDGSPESVTKLLNGGNPNNKGVGADESIVGFTPSKAAQYNDSTAGKTLLPTGTVINAVLAQRVISDYAGSFKGTITNDVYDADYEKILVPKGTTVVGKILRIKNVNEPIQSRMGMVVSWFVLPNGKRVDMSKASGVQDSEGVAAIGGDVNHHFLAQFLGVAAYALLVTETTSNTSSAFTGEQNPEGDIERSMAVQFSPLAQRYLTLVPTITLEPGTPFKVFIEDDVYLKPWGSIYDKLMSNR